MMDVHFDTAKAVKVQNDLKSKIAIEPYKGPLKLIGGADVSFNKYSPTIYAGIVILEYPTMRVLDRASAIMDVTVPYVPGLLSFREIPPLLKAWSNLKTKPDVMMFDGHGIAHPRRVGIASHAGLLFEIPSLGCAKTLLTGVFEDPEIKAGSESILADKNTKEQIGVVLRTKDKTNPVFVSPGHHMDFASAVEITKACVLKHRIPEPTRQAHLFVNEIRKSYLT